MGVAVNLLTLGGGEGRREGGRGDSWQEVVEAMDADGGREGGGRRGEEDVQDRVEAMGTEKEKEGQGLGEDDGGGEQKGRGLVCDGTLSGEDLLSPFIPCLLAYLNRAIAENVGKRGRVREKGRSLDSEFVVLSRWGPKVVYVCVFIPPSRYAVD